MACRSCMVRMVFGLAIWTIMGMASLGRAEVVISEIMFDPASTSDSTWEFIELFNGGTTSVDLSGFVLDDDSGSPLGTANVGAGMLGPGEFAVLFNGTNTVGALDAAWLGAQAPPGHQIQWIAVSPWPSLTNSGKRIGLWHDLASYGSRDFAAAEDEVAYSNGSGWPEADGAGSIFLSDVALDNRLGSSWQLSQAGVGLAWASQAAGDNGGINFGSPGVAPVSIPEPTSGLLAGVGLLFALSTRRRGRWSGGPSAGTGLRNRAVG